MHFGKTAFRHIEWEPLLIVAIGALSFVLGAGRFLARHHFSFADALHCCVAVVPAGLLLLVTSYVFQHAMFSSVIPLAIVGLLAYSSPAFDLALGMALMGVVAESALSERKVEKAARDQNEDADERK